MAYLAKRLPRAAMVCAGAGTLGVMYGARLIESERKFTYEIITAAEKLDRMSSSPSTVI